MTARVHYAWVVAGVAFLSLVMASGFRSTTGVLLIPLHQEFGWSHETIGLAVSLNLLCFGLGAPFAAALIERAGVRRVVGTALAVIAVSALLTIRMTETWQLFLLWGLVNGLATGAVSVPLAAIIANRWFIARRGLVTGLMTASYASGQLVFLPALAWLAGFDWRWAALAIAAVALLLVLPVVLRFMRDRPEDIGLAPYGADESWTPPPATAAPAFGAALDALSHGDALAGVLAPRGNVLRLRRDDERARLDAPDPGGARPRDRAGHRGRPARADRRLRRRRHDGLRMADRPVRPAHAPARLLRPARVCRCSRFPLAFDSAHAAMFAFVVVYGLDWVATVPPTSALATAHFGQQAGVVFAWIFAAHQLGAATAAWGAGSDPHAHRRVHRSLPGSGRARARRGRRRPPDQVGPHRTARARAGDVNDEGRRRRRPSFTAAVTEGR